MTRILIIPLFAVLLCVGWSGCAHRPAATASNQQADEQMRAKTERAFELERRADLVIDYERLDTIRLYVAGQTSPLTTSEETLGAAIASATSKRELAVVIIGKPMRYWFPEPQLRAKVDAIEAVVRAAGFSRVVFQLASATGRPIYRE